MASSGPNYPSSVVDDSAVGTVTWASPGNAAADDGSYATNTGTSGALSHYLNATNFGFSIPAGSTINGILVEIERKSSQAGALRYTYDNTVKLVIGGSVSGDNKAATSTKWPTSDGVASYGGSSDLWGLTPSVSDVNGSNFGVVLAVNIYGSSGATASVDYIRITITYTANEVTGTASVTLANLTPSAAGAVAINAIGSIRLDDSAYGQATGTVSISGVSPVTLAGIAGEATGVIGEPPNTGQGAITLAGITGSGSGTVSVSGIGSIALAGFNGQGAGLISIGGVGAITLAGISGQGAGVVSISGVEGDQLAGITCDATGAVSVTGVGATMLANLVGSAAVRAEIMGSAAVQFAGIIAVSTGSIVRIYAPLTLERRNNHVSMTLKQR